MLELSPNNSRISLLMVEDRILNNPEIGSSTSTPTFFLHLADG